MVRPFEKYPINHHLAQILERVVAVGAVRRGPVIGEVATFNGDEPLGPGSSPELSSLRRFVVVAPHAASARRPRAEREHRARRVARGAHAARDSISARRASSRASVGETRDVGALRARRMGADERAGSRRDDHVAEQSARRRRVLSCGSDRRGARRAHRSSGGRASGDPFRTPRPSVDLSNLGVSRWTTFTLSLSAPQRASAAFSARPFVEVERIGAAAGNPPGIFNPEFRYGANRMWMVSAGVRDSSPACRTCGWGATVRRFRVQIWELTPHPASLIACPECRTCRCPAARMTWRPVRPPTL